MDRDKPIYQICISGAAKGPTLKLAHGLARAVAVQVVQQGHVVMTGATNGLPYYAAQAAKAAGGRHISSIGMSPAASRLAHVKKYRLPTDAYDIIIYTGFEYTGRNLMLIRASDAVIMVGGRIGTLNELTIAIEERKPVGVLMGSGGMTTEVEHVLKAAHRSRSSLMFGEDPAELVRKVIEALDEKYRKLSAPAKSR
jgi:uncharacterized protein (TIGR00725 family)